MADLTDENGESECSKDCEKMRRIFKQYSIEDTGPVGDENLYVVDENGTAA